MKRIFIFFFALCFLPVWPDVQAQVVDMRAFSRQRGYRAYQGVGTILKPVVNPVVESRPDDGSGERRKLPVAEKTLNAATTENRTEEDQTEEFLKYIEENPHVKPDV